MSAYDRWATQGPPDELAYLEHEAREQGEADVMESLTAQGLCQECGGDGRFFNMFQTGDSAGGWADTCDACAGTGKDVHGCDECGSGHHVQQCPAIRKELFR